jgi:TAP-like protein
VLAVTRPAAAPTTTRSSARFDPATSYANARRVARRLGNAVLLTHDGYGHTSDSDPSACVQRVTAS